MRVLRCEILKITTLRGAKNTILVSSLLLLALSLLQLKPLANGLTVGSPELAEGITRVNINLTDFILFVVVPIILGTLVASSEYSSGQFTISLLAVPHRTRLFLAKAVLVAGLSFISGIVSAVINTLPLQLYLGKESVWYHGEVGEMLAGLGLACLYWIAMGLLGFSLSVMLRSGTIPLTISLLMALNGLILVMISSVFKYLPANAGLMMFNPEQLLPDPPLMPRLEGGMVLLVWTVSMLAIAAVFFIRRDTGQRLYHVE